jgi:hypothetical protein
MSPSDKWKKLRVYIRRAQFRATAKSRLGSGFAQDVRAQYIGRHTMCLMITGEMDRLDAEKKEVKP